MLGISKAQDDAIRPGDRVMDPTGHAGTCVRMHSYGDGVAEIEWDWQDPRSEPKQVELSDLIRLEL